MIRFIIQRKTLVSMFFIAVTMLGYISYRQLPVELLPQAELPVLIVQVNGLQDMDPEFMERNAIIPLEGQIGRLDGIEKIESYADRRQGRIMVYYTTDVDLKYAYLRLEEKVNVLHDQLADDFLVNVLKVDTGQLANLFMNLQVRGSGGLDRIREIVNRQVLEQLRSIDGVATVEIFGGRDKTVEIILDKEKASAYNLTPGRLRTLLARSGQQTSFAGSIKGPDRSYFVNVVSEFHSLGDLESIVIDPSTPVLLKDVAQIFKGVKEETTLSRVNGKEALTLQLIRDQLVNLIDLSDKTHDVVDALNKKLKPYDLEIVVQYDAAETLKENIDLIIRLAIGGAVLAILVLWFFLKDVMLASVVALAIPVSVLSAFNLFYAFGISLNSLSLVGMALAIGMLLDNSVVVLENIFRLREKGLAVDQAVIQGTRDVARAVTAATLTTISVFIPFVFASDYMVRLLGYQIGVSIVSALIISLIVALLLIPMLTHWLMLRRERTKPFEAYHFSAKPLRLYRFFLKTSVRLPLRIVLTTLVLFFSSLLLAITFSLAGQEEVETTEFNLYVTMPGGATLETTDKTVADLEELLSDVQEVDDLISQIYEEEAVLTLKLKEDFEDINHLDVAGVKEKIDDKISNFRTADVSFEQPSSSSRFRGSRSGGPGEGMLGGRLGAFLGISNASESVVLKGQDYAVMRNLADDIAYQLENLSAVRSSRVNAADNRPEIHLLFDRLLMNEFNIPLTNVSSELSSFQSEVNAGLTFKEDAEYYDIIIRLSELEEKSPADLRAVVVPAEDNASLPLDQISQIIYTEGKSSIHRLNQERQIDIRYRFEQEITESSKYLEAARNEVDELIAAMEIPPGIAVEVVHDETDWSDFYFLMVVAFVLIFMILASVFESLLSPWVILFTIPLAGVGSLLAILFTGNSLLNANTLVGFLILLGVVVNNGIILIDFIRLLRRRGYSIQRALIVAGQARLRPILITAITTIIALLPLALGKAEYVSKIASPFAITVIGGLMFSTTFTLLIIPTVYNALLQITAWINRLSGKIKLLQILLLAAGSVLIWFKVDSVIWMIIDFILLLAVIPGITWLVQQSLRRANSRLFKPDEDIAITVRNLYKIYDHPSKLVHDFKIARADKGKAGQSVTPERVVWQFGLLAFLVYFIYFYLTSGFWILILMHLLYFYVLFLLRVYLPGKNIPKRKFTHRLVLWGLPAVNALILYNISASLLTVALIALVWYFALSIYTASVRLQKEGIEIHRIAGRFAGLRRWFYRFVNVIPIVGRRRRPFTALRQVNLDIGQGMFGLLGPNGAGKTTIMRIICGILEQNYGTVRINGIDTRRQREELQALIGYLPQEFGMYENMTAEEFLNYQAIQKSIYDAAERRKRIEYVLRAVHLESERHQRIGSFSGGMKQRMGIAQTLLHLPRILVVDEPTAGLDPRERIRFRNLLVELSRKRVVIFSTHIIEDIASSCDRVAVLNRGQVKYVGTPQDMIIQAEGTVYQADIAPEAFEEIRGRYNIIHHVQIKDKIRIRCLASDQPRIQNVIPVHPTLEDAYLWLVANVSESETGKNGSPKI